MTAALLALALVLPCVYLYGKRRGRTEGIKVTLHVWEYSLIQRLEPMPKQTIDDAFANYESDFERTSGYSRGYR